MTTATTAPHNFPDFTTYIEHLDAGQLAHLLASRPDATSPPPRDFSQLATRLSSVHSAHAALENLNEFELGVLALLVDAGAQFQPVSAPELVSTLSQELHAHPDLRPAQRELLEPLLPQLLDTAFNHLHSLGLVFGNHSWVQVPFHSRSIFPPESFATFGHLRLQQIESKLAACDQRQLRVLETLQAHHYGHTKNDVEHIDPQHPVAQLLAAGLVLRHNDVQVYLAPLARYALEADTADPIPNPWTPLVAIHAAYIAGQRPHTYTAERSTTGSQVEAVASAEPESDRISQRSLLATDLSVGPAEEYALTQGIELIRLVRSLIASIRTNPIKLLKNGTLGVRSLKYIAGLLAVEPATASRVITTSVAAQLIAPGHPHPNPPEDDLYDYLTCTANAEVWMDSPGEVQWAWLLQSYWQRGCFRMMDGESDRRLFDEFTYVPLLESLRHRLGKTWWFAQAFDCSVQQQTIFWNPITKTLHPELVAELLDDASWYGLISPQHGPSAIVGALWRDSVQVAGLAEPDHLPLLPEIQAMTTALFPPPVTHLIAQGDMTLLAPGPLPANATRLLHAFATVESPGLATVYRVSDTSLQQGLDRGESLQNFLALLEQYCVGEIPQPLRYAIEDASRTDSSAIIGSAFSYVRSTDPATLAAILHHPVAAKVGLRQIAPEVAIAQVQIHRLRQQLAGAGFRLLLENEAGAHIALEQEYVLRSTKASNNFWAASPAPQVDYAAIHGMVTALQREEVIGQRTSTHDIVLSLKEAIATQRQVLLGSVDGAGEIQWLELTPIALSQGRLSAIVSGSDEVERFELHRVTSVQLLEGSLATNELTHNGR
ncbi:MAG: helicase-associated domain-containing protein [Corynebacterium sp.]|nr:helicase-associated domain-containing protein [Corynebacterium sp.]